MAALPDATYIGFTGTPIDRLAKGQSAFKTLGVDDPQGYLGKYASADGATVPLQKRHFMSADNGRRPGQSRQLHRLHRSARGRPLVCV